MVGDISNTLVSFAPLVRSPLAAVVFFELIRLQHHRSRRRSSTKPASEIEALGATDARSRQPGRARAVLGRAARVPGDPRAVDRDPFAPCSVHLSESVEEVEFIRDGGRSVAPVARRGRSSWNPAWIAPGVSPVQFLDDSGFLDARVLAVHGVQMTPGDLARLAARGTTLVTCPRSNGHTGAGAPPIEDFYASGVRVAVGTDSLASAPDLNVFAELATMRALAPSVPASRLLASATIEGRAGAWLRRRLRHHRAGQVRRGSWPSTFRPALTMWKNISCLESGRNRCWIAGIEIADC